VKALELKLLDGYDQHISSRLYTCMKWTLGTDFFYYLGDNPGFVGRYDAAYFGCAEITVALLKLEEWDTEATDFHGNTALTWAARRGREGS